MSASLNRVLVCLAICFTAVSTVQAQVNLESIDSPESNLDTVNTDIVLGAGSKVGDLESVNGRIQLGDGVQAGTIDAVNGEIRLGAEVRAVSVSTVNGDIRAEPGLMVEDEVETVNGRIDLGAGARLGGDVSTVNGQVQLDSATVAGKLELVSGEIDTGRGSVIEQGIRVKKPTGWSDNRRNPRVIVGPETIVRGPIRLEVETDLWVHDTASIQTVEGGSAKRYSGERP